MKIRLIDSKAIRSQSLKKYFELQFSHSHVSHGQRIERLTGKKYAILDEDHFDVFLLHISDQICHLEDEEEYGMGRSGAYITNVNRKFPNSKIFIYSGGGARIVPDKESAHSFAIVQGNNKWEVTLAQPRSVWVCREPVHSADTLPYGFLDALARSLTSGDAFKNPHEDLDDRLELLHQMLQYEDHSLKEEMLNPYRSKEWGNSFIATWETSLFNSMNQTNLNTYLKEFASFRNQILNLSQQ